MHQNLVHLVGDFSSVQVLLLSVAKWMDHLETLSDAIDLLCLLLRFDVMFNNNFALRLSLNYDEM